MRSMSPTFQYQKQEIVNSPDSNLSSDVINSIGEGSNYNSSFDSDPDRQFDLVYENKSPTFAKNENT